MPAPLVAEPMNHADAKRHWLTSNAALLLLLPLVKLSLHFWNNAQGGYGIFRDELYFIACGEHLAWGYVDQPPMVAIAAAVERALLGDSLFAIRFLPALAGAAVVLVTGLIARELGAGRFGVFLAQLAALIAPVFLAIHTILSMNVFEHLFWALAVLVAVRIARLGAPRWWIVFGVIVGLGLLTKHSMAFFCIALFAGLLISAERRQLAQRWFWSGAAIAGLIFLPHVIWQVQNDFPMVELLRNGQLYKNAPFAPGAFFWGMFLEFHPANIVLAAGALWFLLIAPQGKPYRFLGWTVVTLLVLFVALKAKSYYVAPIYPLLYAAGATALAMWTAGNVGRWVRGALVALMIFTGIATAPLAMPLLPPHDFIAYAQRLGIAGPPTERHQMGPLPQFFADMHGWEEMVVEIARVYHSLPPEERAKAAIFADNYGEAAAVDFFGRKYGLPKAIGGHNNYFLWGPRDYTGEIVITVGVSREDAASSFEELQEAGRFSHPYAMPYEQRNPILICRRPKFKNIHEVWPQVKGYI
ncbi:MAG: glycosyltransferase family 39 protein [Candidatus Acidiferrales bacterium]